MIFYFLPVTALARQELLYKYVQNDIGVYGGHIYPYTISQKEYQQVITTGWKDEGIAFYGLK